MSQSTKQTGRVVDFISTALIVYQEDTNMSKKKLTVLSSFLLCICLLSGCGRAGEAITSEPPEPAITAEPAEIKDAEDTQDTEDTQDNQAPAVDTVSDPISGEPSGPLETDSERTEVSLFDEVNETVYATGTVNIRASYSADSEKLGSLSKGTSITRTGIGTGEAEGWSRVSLSDGTTAYISSQYLSTTKPAVQSSTGGGAGTGTGGGSQQQGTPSSSDSQQDGYISYEEPPWGEHITDPAEIASGNENPYDTIYHPIP